MLRDTCLYFPHIEVRDQSWARSYALFWDEIRTIVPDAVEKPYTIPDLEILHGEGILRPEKLSYFPAAIDAASKTMLENWDSIDQSFRFSNAHMRIAFDYDDYHLMHPEKMTTELIEQFRKHLKVNLPSAGAIDRHSYRDDDQWEVTDPRMATAYMAILANEISSLTRANPVTNYPSLRVPNPGLEVREHGWDGTGPRLLDIVMENTMVDPNADIRKIISFKKENQALFNDFRMELDRLGASIRTGGSRSDLQNIYSRKIKPKIESVRGGLTRNHLHWVGGGCIAIPAVPDSAAAVAELLGATGNLTLAATFGVVATGVAIGARQSSRNMLRGEPMSYLASIEGKFSLPIWEQ